MERLDKILAHIGKGSRKEVRGLIKAGLVKVNEKVITDPGFKIDLNDDLIDVGGETIRYSRYVYLMLNKPQGYITATEDNYHNTVLELIDNEDRRKDLFPVGRLDKDTEGLLLLTNDGPLGHMLTSPKYKVPKRYYFKTLEKMEANSLNTLLEGVDLGDFFAIAESVAVLSANSGELVISEGKFHQVKRMCAALGYTIVYLERTDFGPLALDRSLTRGSYRSLTDNEIALLKKSVEG